MPWSRRIFATNINNYKHTITKVQGSARKKDQMILTANFLLPFPYWNGETLLSSTITEHLIFFVIFSSARKLGRQSINSTCPNNIVQHKQEEGKTRNKNLNVLISAPSNKHILGPFLSIHQPDWLCRHKLFFYNIFIFPFRSYLAQLSSRCGGDKGRKRRRYKKAPAIF